MPKKNSHGAMWNVHVIGLQSTTFYIEKTTIKTKKNNLNIQLNLANISIEKLFNLYENSNNKEFEERGLAALLSLKNYYYSLPANHKEFNLCYKNIRKEIDNAFSNVQYNDNEFNNNLSDNNNSKTSKAFYLIPGVSALGTIALTALIIIGIFSNPITLGIAIGGAIVTGLTFIGSLIYKGWR